MYLAQRLRVDMQLKFRFCLKMAPKTLVSKGISINVVSSTRDWILSRPNSANVHSTGDVENA